MNNELLDALTILEKEKNISKETLLEAIENSLLTACKNHFGKADNVKVVIDPDTCEYHCYQEKTVVETVEDPIEQISLQNAQMINGKYTLGDIVQVEVKSKEFGRIATQNAKNVILQKIREEERKVIYDEYFSMEKEVVTGVVQRYVGRNVSINLGKADALLTESEQIKGETFQPTERIKVYILEVKATSKGPKILVSRTHPELVKRLFESEVSEVRDGIVEIKAISREAGSRTKIAVWSNDPDVDPVGACVGMNGARVNAIVNELRGEKIDIITWDENPAILIQNALSPAKVISVIADADEKAAKVVVPDYQLSLAIGKEGQNARLAARLTGFKIDIKSETQARESGDFLDYENDYEDDEYDDNYEYDEEGYYKDPDATEEIPTEAEASTEEVPVEETSAAPVSTVSAKEETESATPRTEIQTQEEVIQRLKEINKDVCNADKQEIDQLKQTFYKLHKAEQDTARKVFVENGGNADEFVPVPDPLEKEFKEVMGAIKEKRNAMTAAQEQEKEENLQKKLAILEKMRMLIESTEDTNKIYNDFKQLQQEWSEIKQIPAGKQNELYRSYQLYTEKFYDMVKLNNEFREYDFKKNLEQKTRLCEAAEKLAEEPDVVSAFHQLQNLHQEFRSIGPVSKELRESLWALRLLLRL